MVIIHLELAFPFHMNDASSNRVLMEYSSLGEMNKSGLKNGKCSAINGIIWVILFVFSWCCFAVRKISIYK